MTEKVCEILCFDAVFVDEITRETITFAYVQNVVSEGDDYVIIFLDGTTKKISSNIYSYEGMFVQ